MLWLDQHPSATLALALGVSAPSVRWVFPFSNGHDVVIRGARIESLRAGGRERMGSARVHGTRSAADFDLLPRCDRDIPYGWPALAYPTGYGFACDLDGRVARFESRGPGAITPGLSPRLTEYPDPDGFTEDCIARLAVGHGPRVRASPPRAMIAKVKLLIRALGAPEVVGPARAWVRFHGEHAVVWPEAGTEFGSTLLAALHDLGACEGCSRHDPRDVLSLGTWRFAQPRRGEEHFALESSPTLDVPLPQLAEALGRSPSELAATQLDLRFNEVTRVLPRRVRLPA
jgi:hypothetical protein